MSYFISLSLSLLSWKSHLEDQRKYIKPLIDCPARSRWLKIQWPLMVMKVMMVVIMEVVSGGVGGGDPDNGDGGGTADDDDDGGGGGDNGEDGGDVGGADNVDDDSGDGSDGVDDGGIMEVALVGMMLRMTMSEAVMMVVVVADMTNR